MNVEVVCHSESAARTACREVAAEVLEECRVAGPPVDARLIADRLGLEIALDASQHGRGRIKRLRGRTTILVRPEDRPERLQWTIAHEIGEHVAHRVFRRLDFDPDLAGPRIREQIANEMASQLLLPGDSFLDDARRLDADLPRLKQTYATASHELILTGLLRLPELSLVTVCDHGRITRRRGNGQLSPPPLLPIERDVWRRVYGSGHPADETAEGVRVQGWAVHEPGWKRELLRTTALDMMEGHELQVDEQPMLDADSLAPAVDVS